MYIIMIIMLVVLSGWADCEENNGKCIQKELDVLHNRTMDIVDDHDSIEKNISTLPEQIQKVKEAYEAFSKKYKTTASQTLTVENDIATLKQHLLLNQNILKNETSSDIFDTSLVLGVQLQPSYNNNNENEGFNHSTFYAKINIDNRFEQNNNIEKLYFSFPPSNYGIDLEYLGTPVEHNATAPVSITSAPKNFNDVSKTFQGMVYTSLPFYNFNQASQIGLLGQYGFMTRDLKDQNENTINTYWAVGLEYVYSDLLSPSLKPGSTIYNKRYPKAKFNFVRRQYDFFAGRQDTYRTVMDFEYKVGAFLLGFNANIGGEESTMYLKFGIVKSMDDIASFFFTK